MKIADALEPEHRVEDEERDHLLAVRRVRRRRGHPRRHRARFVDAFLQDLARLVLAVPHQLIGVLRTVELPERLIHADLAEHPFHAERAGFVGDDRHQARADDLVANQRAERAQVGHRGRDLAFAAVFEQRLERVELGHRQRLLDVAAAHRRCRRARPRRSRRYFISGLFSPGRIVRDVFDLPCRRSESRSGRGTCELIFGELLRVVRDVLAFAGGADAVALDRFGEDHGRAAGVFDRRLVGGVDLVRIVAAAVERQISSSDNRRRARAFPDTCRRSFRARRRRRCDL